MRKQANRWLVAVFLLFFIFSGIHMTAFGEEPAKDPLAQLEEEMGIGEEIQRIQEYLDGLRPEGRTVSLTDLMQVIIQGNMKEIVNTAGKLLEDALFSQAKEGQALLVQVAVLGLTGAVFSHAASAFKGSQIPETAFYMIYLLIFTCLAGSFLSSIQITAQVLDQILEFVRLLMPAYFISVAFAGGSTSAAAFYEIALGAAWAVQWLCRQVFLSIVRVYGLLVLGDHMMEEPFFSKMTELMEKIVSWGLRSILGLTLGLQILQSLVLPYADSAGRSAIMKFAEMIPGLGQATGAAARLVFGSSVLIKNSLGAAAVLILAVITLVPVVKLAVLMVMYQGAAALLQPVCDKRIISCIQGMAAGHGLLLRITLYSLFLFILVIAITCAGTNVTYLAAYQTVSLKHKNRQRKGMGEILLEWARNIIFFMVFLSVISHLLADASYEKYIRFFAGIVLILITVSPLKGGLDFQEKAGRFFEEFSFFQEKEQAGKALSKADQERMGAFLAEYKKEAEARIRETVQAEGVICSQAEVEIEKDEKSGEYGTIRKIILHLKEEKMTSPQDEETKMVKEKAGEEVSVKVEIPPVITKEKQERPGTESKQEQQLKRKVAQYYGLEEACIEIWWEDDQGEMAVSASVRSDPDDPVYAISGKQQ